MFCPRCHTELPDAAYACSQCGMVVSPSVQVGQSSTTATPETPASLYQPTSFSYLPAGTPQWPAVVPQHIWQMPYDQAQSQPGQLSSEVAAEKLTARKNSLSAPTVLLLFFVSILVGGGLTYGLLALGRGNTQPTPPLTLHVSSTPAASATPGSITPTPTTTNQLPTPTSFLTLSTNVANDVGISVKYPSSWAIDPPQKSSQSTYLDLHPSPQNGLIMN